MNPFLTHRRVITMVLLLFVVAMIVFGQMVLNGRLSPAATLVYWGGCLMLTLGAIGLSLVDLLRTLGETRRTQRELVNETIERIEHESGRPKTGA